MLNREEIPRPLLCPVPRSPNRTTPPPPRAGGCQHPPPRRQVPCLHRQPCLWSTVLWPQPEPHCCPSPAAARARGTQPHRFTPTHSSALAPCLAKLTVSQQGVLRAKVAPSLPGEGRGRGSFPSAQLWWDSSRGWVQILCSPVQE